MIESHRRHEHESYYIHCDRRSLHYCQTIVACGQKSRYS